MSAPLFGSLKISARSNRIDKNRKGAGLCNSYNLSLKLHITLSLEFYVNINTCILPQWWIFTASIGSRYQP